MRVLLNITGMTTKPEMLMYLPKYFILYKKKLLICLRTPKLGAKFLKYYVLNSQNICRYILSKINVVQ